MRGPGRVASGSRAARSARSASRATATTRAPTVDIPITHHEWRWSTSHDTETGGITGTKDKNYNLVWFVESCLSNALRMEEYCRDAERDGDTELTDLFTKAQADSKKGAELGKSLLAARLSG